MIVSQYTGSQRLLLVNQVIAQCGSCSRFINQIEVTKLLTRICWRRIFRLSSNLM